MTGEHPNTERLLATEKVSPSGDCPRCKRWKLYQNLCPCKRFECAQPWRNEVPEENWSEIYAPDAEDAAERFAQESDCDGDYIIIRNGSAEIWTRDADGTVEKWDIEAESEPTYTARRKSGE